MFLENERSNIRFRSLAIVFEDHAVDDREVNVRIILRDGLHDWTLRKADADNEIVTALSERPHCRFDRDRIARLDIANDYIQWGLATARLAVGQHARLGALHSVPSRGIERTIVFAADVKDNADANLARIVSAVSRVITGLAGKN